MKALEVLLRGYYLLLASSPSISTAVMGGVGGLVVERGAGKVLGGWWGA